MGLFMQELLLIIVGLVGLWLGTELVIKGAVNIANHFGLSHVFIGIAILAIGTDLPEVIIAIDASIKSLVVGVDTSGIIVGNAIGSAYSQISLVLGIVGLFTSLTIGKKNLYESGVMLLASVLLFLFLGIDESISRIDGFILIIVYGIYYFRLLRNESARSKIRKKKSRKGIEKNAFILAGGILIVFFASRLVVTHALEFADNQGLKQSFVGIIIIGIGTSLPELAVSLNAVRKKAYGLSVGNLIGSNIFDLLVPVGLGSTISKIKIDKMLINFDLPVLFGLSLVVLFFFYKKKGLQRIEALLLVIIFIVYGFLKVIGL